MNNKAVKYLLLNDDVEKADQLLKTFIRDSSDANIHELQYMWYEYLVGKSCLRQKKYGPGFKQFKFIEKALAEMYEDQVKLLLNKTIFYLL